MLYADASHKNVYCGGLVGRFGRGLIYNSASSGRVGPSTGEAAEDSDTYKGALVGSVEANANRKTTLSGCYYLEGTANLPYGSKSTVTNPAPVDVISYSDDGSLNGVSTSGATFVDVALNDWVDARTGYNAWFFGTKLEMVFE